VTTGGPSPWRVGLSRRHVWLLFRAHSVSIEVVRQLEPLAEFIIDLLRAGQIDHVRVAVRAGRQHTGYTRIVNPLRKVEQKLQRPHTRAHLGDLAMALEEDSDVNRVLIDRPELGKPVK
jgi:hypothetical protein